MKRASNVLITMGLGFVVGLFWAWTPGWAADVPTMTDLTAGCPSTLCGGNYSVATAVSHGQVVGYSLTGEIYSQGGVATDECGQPVTHAFSWVAPGPMQDLGAIASSLNYVEVSNGLVVSTAPTGTFDADGQCLYHVVYWNGLSPASMQDMGVLVGGSYSQIIAGSAVSNGMVVGLSSTPPLIGTPPHFAEHAFWWTAPGPMHDLGVLAGGANSSASAVDNGLVIGGSDSSTGGQSFWSAPPSNPAMHVLVGGGPSGASAVNDGLVAGIGSSGVVTWTVTGPPWTAAGPPQVRGVLGGPASGPGSDTSASAVNNGQVVGYSYTGAQDPEGSPVTHAFSWVAPGPMQDLGALGGAQATSTDSWAIAVSNGQVVGSSVTGPFTFSSNAEPGEHAFSWSRAAGMVDLGILDQDFSQAYAVDNGLVVGTAATNGATAASFGLAQHAVLWSFCGNGVVDAPFEQCDDGNTTNGDGCSATCQIEPCYTCSGQPSTCSSSPALVGTFCDDHNPCTKNTTCQADRTCGGGAPVCAPADQCHVAACDSTTGACSNSPAPGYTTPCNADSNGCTPNDYCLNGVCTAGSAPDCRALLNDTLTCTTDNCVSTDTNAFQCTKSIVAGSCLIGGVCYHSGDPNPVSPQCQQCISAVSQTTFTNKANGSACDDHNACTQLDTCQNGACTGAKFLSCVDSNPCTQDTCDPVNGCQNTLVAGCQTGGSTFIDPVDGIPPCVNYDSASNTCPLSVPNVVDLRIPVANFTSPTYINVTSLTPNPAAGACDFALRDASDNVASCIQLQASPDPSGTFNPPVQATFHWQNVPYTQTSGGQSCPHEAQLLKANDCCVGATGSGGSTYVDEGFLQVYTQGQCLPTGLCKDTPTQCSADVACRIALSNSTCGLLTNNSGLSCDCPGNSKEPGCSAAATNCDPAGDGWTVPLAHFSQYAVGSLASPPGAFQCYETFLLPPPPAAAAVSLVDQFGTLTTTVQKPRSLCTPTDLNGQDPAAPSRLEYLQSYPFSGRRHYLPGATRQRQQVQDQFGTHTLDVLSPDRLLVPAAVALADQPSPLASTSLDHLTCYTVRPSRGSAPFQPIILAVDDFFGQSQSIKLLRPSELCVPTDKNSEAVGAESNPWRLMCYRATHKFSAVGRVNTNNELGPSVVVPRGVEKLCVAAVKP